MEQVENARNFAILQVILCELWLGFCIDVNRVIERFGNDFLHGGGKEEGFEWFEGCL